MLKNKVFTRKYFPKLRHENFAGILSAPSPNDYIQIILGIRSKASMSFDCANLTHVRQQISNLGYNYTVSIIIFGFMPIQLSECYNSSISFLQCMHKRLARKPFGLHAFSLLYPGVCANLKIITACFFLRLFFQSP